MNNFWHLWLNIRYGMVNFSQRHFWAPANGFVKNLLSVPENNFWFIERPCGPDDGRVQQHERQDRARVHQEVEGLCLRVYNFYFLYDFYLQRTHWLESYISNECVGGW